MFKHISFIILVIYISLISENVEASIVDPTKTYTYEKMIKDIHTLKETYPDLIEYKTIGKTPFNRNIVAVKLGKGDPTVFINGSVHAREWISTLINMKMIEEYANAYKNNELIQNYQVTDLLNENAIWFVPMVNPDGVTLQQKGIYAYPERYHHELIKMNDGSTDFRRWKANAQGIDLNRQYPPDWETKTNITRPYWWNYKGEKPFQTLENQAIRDFMYEITPEIAVSYHTSGRILYWNYKNKNYNRDYQLAIKFSDITGYDLVPYNENPTGKHFLSWCVEEFEIPCFTPELSYYAGQTHVPLFVFADEWSRNEEVGLWLLAEAYELKNKVDFTVSFEKKVKVDEQTVLYTEPSFLSLGTMKIYPQLIKTYEKSNNWYRIKTSNGDRWLYLDGRFKDIPARIIFNYIKLLVW